MMMLFELLFSKHQFDTSDMAPWTDGITNAFFIWYKEQCKYISGCSKQVLVPFPNGLLCFPNQQCAEISETLVPQTVNYFHQTVWYGLFSIWKGLTKILNKCSGQSESLDFDSISLGPVSQCVWTYLVSCTNTIVSVQPHVMSESFLTIDLLFPHKKSHITCNA